MAARAPRPGCFLYAFPEDAGTSMPSTLLDAEDMRRGLLRIAHEIVERNKGCQSLMLVGIRTRGVPLARRLASHLQEIEHREVPVGALDVRPHRDDRDPRQAVPEESNIPSSPDEQTVVLVDDIIYTGRTARAAMDALIHYGRPARVQLAVLVDRGHRELPIRPDYVARNVPTSASEWLVVHLQEVDGADEVLLTERKQDAL